MSETSGGGTWVKWAPFVGAFVLMLARYITLVIGAKLPDWVPAEFKTEAFWVGLIMLILTTVWGFIRTWKRTAPKPPEAKMPRVRHIGNPVSLFLLIPLAALLTGCGTMKITPIQGASGPDGFMASCQLYGPRPQLCAAEPVPISDPGDPPGTWLGRQMRAAADWSTEHPVWAGFIAAVVAFIPIAEKNDWWGAFDRDDGDKKDPEPAPAEDKEVDANVKGTGNRLNIDYVYVPGGGAMPNVGATVDGDGNQVAIEVKPLEK